MSRLSFSRTKNYRRLRFKTSAGRWVFLTIWRDPFGIIHTIKNAAIGPGVLSHAERKFQAIRNRAVMA
jgi:hypothetical protein